MAEFWKLNPADWNVGTDDLTLEQEAAYLRVVNAIHLYDQPIRHNMRVLAGLWRCNERKARRLLQELIDAGKLAIEDECIVNERAMEEVSTRRRTHVDRQSAGRAGGIASGNSRRKSRENNNQGEAPASTREEKNRGEESPPLPPEGESQPDFLDSEQDRDASAQKAGGRQRRSQFPEDWRPPDRLRAKGRELGFSDRQIDDLAEACVNHHRAKGTVFADHEAAFRTWLSNEKRFAAERGHRSGRSPPDQQRTSSSRLVKRAMQSAEGGYS